MYAFTAIFDACVLYPAPLRDLLMYLTGSDLFQARWTDEIHDEWIRNLLKNRPGLNPKNLERTRSLMDAYVDDCLVIGYEPLIETLQLPDPKDRHVLAAAIKTRASFIVTFNIKDFPSAALVPHGIQAVTPDEFVMRLIAEDYREVLKFVKRQRENMTRPAKTVDQYLVTLEAQRLPKTAMFLRKHREEI
ncbi:MAG: PIN domain-containing protein [Planctomycetaceae bacterium]|nr:PIN domain-containing protein [Planctomycetaceae bacterium]